MSSFRQPQLPVVDSVLFNSAPFSTTIKLRKTDKIRKAVKHVKRHKKAYTVGVVFVAGAYVGYRYGVNSTVVSADVMQAVEIGAVDTFIDGVYKSGLIPVHMTDQQYQLYHGALVNAGLITSDVSKDAFDMLEDVRGWVGYQPAA